MFAGEDPPISALTGECSVSIKATETFYLQVPMLVSTLLVLAGEEFP